MTAKATRSVTATSRRATPWNLSSARSPPKTKARARNGKATRSKPPLPNVQRALTRTWRRAERATSHASANPPAITPSCSSHSVGEALPAMDSTRRSTGERSMLMAMDWTARRERSALAASRPGLRSFHHRGEEPVGVVDVGIEAQVLAGAGNRHALAPEHLGRGDEAEVGMRGEEPGDDVLVFLDEQAARAVDQAPAGLHQRSGRREYGALLRVELDQAGRALARLEVGIAPQGSQPGAGRIDEHAVDLAAQALHLRIVLAGDALRKHVGQPGALQARGEVGETLVGDVERVEPARGIHRRAHLERLAAGAGAEVDHHLAALRLHQHAEDLAALVLHFHG